MKISIGTKIKDGPWGGGNLFAINLAKFLINRGHDVVFNLDDDDIDIILLTEPRKTSESSAYTHEHCKDYKKFVKNDSVIIHRINECDERKNTNYVNKYMIFANKVADYTIFVSKWLEDLYITQGLKNQNISTILGGADVEIFNRKKLKKFDGNGKIKIVTHHWGANWNKGFDVYSKLDGLLSDKKWNKLIEFTYIGNLPKNFKFVNTRHIEPISGTKLAQQLSKHNLYITASLNEPSGNHHIEAALMGLPIMYIDSGGIKEYCKDFGIEYNLNTLETKIIEFKENYEIYNTKMEKYPFTSNKMCEEYLNLFLKAYINKDKVKKFYGNTSSKQIYKIKKVLNRYMRNFKLKNFFGLI